MDCLLPAAIEASRARPSPAAKITAGQIITLLDGNADEIERLKRKTSKLASTEGLTPPEAFQFGECLTHIIRLYDERDTIVNTILKALSLYDRDWRPALIEELETNAEAREVYATYHAELAPLLQNYDRLQRERDQLLNQEPEPQTDHVLSDGWMKRALNRPLVSAGERI